MKVAQQQAAAGSPVNNELEDFLESKATSIKSLSDYSMVVRAFVRANSTLPSSALLQLLNACSVLLGLSCHHAAARCPINCLTEWFF